nr:hypothetical protein CFP56_09982 [Quercus suber]
MDPGLIRAYEAGLAAAHSLKPAFLSTFAAQKSSEAAEKLAQITTSTPTYDPVEDINDNIIITTSTSSSSTTITTKTPGVKFDWGEYTTIDLNDIKSEASPTTPPSPPPPHHDSWPWYIVLLRLSWLIILLVFNIAMFPVRHPIITIILGLYGGWSLMEQPEMRWFLYSRILRLETTADRPRNWLGRLHDRLFPAVDGETSRYPFLRFPTSAYQRTLLWALVVVLPLLFFLLREGPQSTQPLVDHDLDWSYDKRFSLQEPTRYKDMEAWVAAGPPHRTSTVADNRLKTTVTVTDYITVGMSACDHPPPATVTRTHTVTQTEHVHGDHAHSHGDHAAHVKYGDLPTADAVKRTMADGGGRVFCAVCRQMHCCEVPY